jgi:hypothetical protein
LLSITQAPRWRSGEEEKNMRTKTEAERNARDIVDYWMVGTAFTGWIPGSSFLSAGGDMLMIRQVADAFGVGVFDQEAVKAHLAGVMAGALGGTVASEVLSALPILGWIAKSAILTTKVGLIGEAVIDYFHDHSPLPD